MRCKAFTLDGVQCSRDAEPGSKFCWQHQEKKLIYQPKVKKSNIIKKLPTDVFTQIGQFLTYPEISKSLVSGFPKNIKILKDCAVVNNYNVKEIESLAQNYPNIKSLTLTGKSKDFFIYLDEEKGKTICVADPVIYNFKKTEDLKIQNISYIDIDIVDFEWNQFPKLKSLDVDFEVDTNSELLNTLKFFKYDSDVRLQNFGNIETYIGLIDKNSRIENLRRLVNSSHLHNALTKNNFFHTARSLQNGEKLEVLELSGTIDDYYPFNPNIIKNFPPNLKMLSLDATILFFELPLENLQYFIQYTNNNFEFLLPILLKLPKLKYFELQYLSFANLSIDHLSLLEKLANNGVKFTFRKIFLENMHFEHKELFSYLKFGGNSAVYELRKLERKMKKEVKSVHTIFPKLQKIFGLSDLDMMTYSLKTHPFTQEQWLRNNNFYLPRDCTSYL